MGEGREDREAESTIITIRSCLLHGRRWTCRRLTSCSNTSTRSVRQAPVASRSSPPSPHPRCFLGRPPLGGNIIPLIRVTRRTPTTTTTAITIATTTASTATVEVVVTTSRRSQRPNVRCTTAPPCCRGTPFPNVWTHPPKILPPPSQPPLLPPLHPLTILLPPHPFLLPPLPPPPHPSSQRGSQRDLEEAVSLWHATTPNATR